MEKHIKIARAHRALSWLQVVNFVVITAITYTTTKDMDIEPMSFLIGVLVGGVFFLGLSAVHRSIAKGAMERRPWARTASQIVACLMLLGFPIGTLIGIYLPINIWPSSEIPPVTAVSE